MVKELTLEKTKSVSDEPNKWSAQMLESFAQAKRGEWSVVDRDNFWGNI